MTLIEATATAVYNKVYNCLRTTVCVHTASMAEKYCRPTVLHQDLLLRMGLRFTKYRNVA
eukprot:1164997-Pyramimonas_sp.AAC.1